jgi:acetylglutamate synthase
VISEVITPFKSTFLRKGVKVVKYIGLKNINKQKLTALLEYAFKRKLKECYLEELADKQCVLYVAGDYKGVIIYTLEEGYNYLDKFAVGDLQSVGIGDLLWGEGKCFWRSRKGNFINSWYFEKADGFLVCGHWVLFWRGYSLKDLEKLKTIIENMEASFE